MGGAERRARAHGRTPAMLGMALTLLVFLMAFGAIPALHWPAAGGHLTSSPSSERASMCMREALRAVARAKVESGMAGSDADRDDADVLVGSEWTPLVTTLGSLEAKRLASSPTWAATLAEQIRSRGLEAGTLAVASFSGSFPGLNIATTCACQALGIDLVAFSSVTASTWGATDPGFTWPEIEVLLVRARVIEAVSVAISVGGDDDRGLDLDDDGRALAESIAERTSAALGARYLCPASLEEAIESRLRLLNLAAARRPIRLFVNVGGTSAALGRSPAILRLQSGWIPARPFDLGPGRGLVARMVERGVPVLHLLNVRDLALRWGIL